MEEEKCKNYEKKILTVDYGDYVVEDEPIIVCSKGHLLCVGKACTDFKEEL
jgi:hypothetical protein